MDSTSTAIVELYRVFSPYRTGDDFEGCSHCIAPAQSSYLAKMPLARLSVQDLDTYAFKAMTTWGDVSHFKHFLPRLLELVILEGVDAFNFVEVLFNKLDYGRWTDWPMAERKAIKAYLQAFWFWSCSSTSFAGTTIQSTPRCAQSAMLVILLANLSTCGSTHAMPLRFVNWLNSFG